MLSYSRQDLTKLISGQLDPKDFNIDSIKLGNCYNQIPVEEIIDIGLFDKITEKYIENASDYTFQERLSTLQKNNAFIHLAGGLSCGITDREISQMRLSKKYIESLRHIHKTQIESVLGNAERELIEDVMWGLDYDLNNFISVYKHSRLYFYFDPNTLELNEIRIGIVDESRYNAKNASH